MASKSRVFQKGFTLIELLVVLAVIGILAGISIPMLIKAKVKAKAANILLVAHFMRDQAFQYYSDNGNFPAGAGINEVPPELKGTYLPDGYTFPVDSSYTLQWENWTGEDGNPVPVMNITVGLLVHTSDGTLARYIEQHIAPDVIQTQPDTYTFPYDMSK